MSITLQNGVVLWPLSYTKQNGWIIYAEEHGRNLFVVKWSNLALALAGKK